MSDCPFCKAGYPFAKYPAESYSIEETDRVRRLLDHDGTQESFEPEMRFIYVPPKIAQQIKELEQKS